MNDQSSTEDAVFSQLVEWMKQVWHGLPETDELVPLLKARCTLDEAELLTGLPFSGTPLDQLAKIKRTTPEELGPKLDVLARKGLVFRRVKNGRTLYRFNDLMFAWMRSPFWPGRNDEHSRTLAPLANRYMLDFIDGWKEASHAGLRVVPIQETLEDRRCVRPFEDVARIINERECWCVANCACRHRKNLDPDNVECSHLLEVCLHFDTLGRYIVENGLGREITREEAHDILRRCAEDGLVHAADTWLEGVQTICNCCKCCCMWLERYHVLNHPTGLDPSNFVVTANTDICKGCGLCVARCPMDTMRLNEAAGEDGPRKVVSVDADHCIGCGVCAYTCPEKALTLVQYGEVREPPKDIRASTALFVRERNATRDRSK